jgi:hypothetical protein
MNSPADRCPLGAGDVDASGTHNDRVWEPAIEAFKTAERRFMEAMLAAGLSGARVGGRLILSRHGICSEGWDHSPALTLWLDPDKVADLDAEH